MPRTLRKLYSQMALLLQGHSDSPNLDARLLVCFACSYDYNHFILNMDKEVDQAMEQKVFSLIRRRMDGYCVASIIGQKDFYNRTFFVNEHVLIPRPDTETLVEEAIRRVGKNSSILDICTGSGCIGISLALETEARSLCLSDISKEALLVAKTNALKYFETANLIESDLLEAIEGDFDVITANPPYVTRSQYEGLSLEVKREPMIALIGDQSLLDEVVRQSYGHLNAGGWFFMELDPSQSERTLMSMEKTGFRNLEGIKDINSLQRVVLGQK